MQLGVKSDLPFYIYFILFPNLSWEGCESQLLNFSAKAMLTESQQVSSLKKQSLNVYKGIVLNSIPEKLCFFYVLFQLSACLYASYATDVTKYSLPILLMALSLYRK